MNDPANVMLSHLYWSSVLRSCCAYEAYQHLYVGRVEPEHVLELLLLNPAFPRSVHFALAEAEKALTAIEDLSPGHRTTSKADRMLGMMLSTLKYGELEHLLADDVNTYLAKAQEECTRVCQEVQARYSLG